MLKNLRKHWETFKSSRPGHRFQDIHKRRAKKDGTKSSHLRRVFMIGLGLLLTAAGLVFLPAPGPGSLVLLAGIGIVASESLLVARALDGMELLLRPWALRAVHWWHGLSRRTRLVLIGVGAVLAVAVAWLIYVYVIR